jgi:riboflavin biosynthesis pyrimidine reductase
VAAVTWRLWPQPAAEVDAAGMYATADRHPPPDRPYVVVNMVAGVDGVISIDGVTKALGSPTDHAIFVQLREVADAILVGASTIRAERYGPARPTPEARSRRLARSQTARPPIVAVSRSVDFDWATPFFTEADPRPILLLPADADVEKLERARLSADVITGGVGGVDLTAGLQELRRRGIEVLLCEGGPSLNSQLLHAGLIDELCLTVAPVVAGGHQPRGIFAGGDEPSSLALRVAHILEEDSFLYLRYRPAPSA